MSTAVLSNRSMSERIEGSINKDVSGGIEISGQHGMVITSMAQAMEFAKLLSIAKEGVPKHCRENVGMCLVICVQAYELKISPIALANKSYVVNDRLAYESAMYQVCLTRRAPILGRPKYEYAGEGQDRTLRVWVELADSTGVLDYKTPKIRDIKPQNSPLWKNDPDQQLGYFAIRSLAKRHFQDVVMGILTVDEMQDSIETVKVVDNGSKADRLASRLIAAPQAPPVAEQPEREKPPQPEQHPEPSIALGFMSKIEAATTTNGIDFIRADIDAAFKFRELDEGELAALVEACDTRENELRT